MTITEAQILKLRRETSLKADLAYLGGLDAKVRTLADEAKEAGRLAFEQPDDQNLWSVYLNLCQQHATWKYVYRTYLEDYCHMLGVVEPGLSWIHYSGAWGYIHKGVFEDLDRVVSALPLGATYHIDYVAGAKLKVDFLEPSREQVFCVRPIVETLQVFLDPGCMKITFGGPT